MCVETIDNGQQKKDDTIEEGLKRTRGRPASVVGGQVELHFGQPPQAENRILSQARGKGNADRRRRETFEFRT
jgi:hypothetical protein